MLISMMSSFVWALGRKHATGTEPNNHSTGVVKSVYRYQTFQLAAGAV